MAQPKYRESDVDTIMNEILGALEIIKTKLPNGEIKIIQDKIESIELSQDDIRDDLRQIKKQLLDPEDGLVVRVNKNTEFRKQREAETKEYTKLLDQHRELLNWKESVTRALWIIFTALAGIVSALLFKTYK